MKVLLVGYGGREHALAIMARNSPMNPKISAVMDKLNPGIKRVVEESGGRTYIAKTTNPSDVVRVAERENPDLVVIGPEEPIFSGVVDALEERGLYLIGHELVDLRPLHLRHEAEGFSGRRRIEVSFNPRIYYVNSLQVDSYSQYVA